MADELAPREMKREPDSLEVSKRGRPSELEWQERARYVLRHLGDPITLQKSPLCRLVTLERMAESRYPNGIVARAGS